MSDTFFCLLLAAGLGRAAAAPVVAPVGVCRGLVIAGGKVDAGSAVAFSDALLDQLADKNGAQATLVSADAVLCRAAGITGENFSALAVAPSEQAGALLLLWTQRLYLTDLSRVTLSSSPQGARAELLWARPALGQVRQAQAAVAQPLTKNTAPLLAGKVAQLLQTGWDGALAVTSSGQAPGPETSPQMTPTLPPAPPEAPPAPTPPTTALPPAAPPATEPAAPDANNGFTEAARQALNGGNATKALDLIAQALQAGENRTPALLLRAQAYAALQAPERQRDALAAALAGDKTLYQPRLVLAALARDRGLWQSAAQIYRDAIAAQPTSAAAYVALASLYQDQRRSGEALQVLQDGVKAAPENLSLLYVLGGEYKRRGMLGPAEETYATLAGLAAGQQKADALYELGRIYIDAGQYTAAFEALRQAAEAAPAGQAQHYAELFVACDRTVGQGLEAGFKALADLEGHPQAAPREEVYQRLNAALAQIQKIKDFATPLKLPEDQQLVLDQRVLYYAAAFEAVTWALDYVDTGNAGSRARALQRRREAAAMPAQWGGR